MSNNNAKSPYQKKAKTPYKYSELYQSWRNATGMRKKQLAEQHTARHLGPVNRRVS